MDSNGTGKTDDKVHNSRVRKKKKNYWNKDKAYIESKRPSNDKDLAEECKKLKEYINGKYHN
jgi:hypothetical protein